MAADIKVIDCRQSDNEYLHKDFHGALCYALKYLDDTFGQQATHDYLVQVGKTYFKPLSEKLKTDGLKALEDYWQEIFQKEAGRFTLRYEGDRLVLEVQECPAIAHLKKNNHLFTDRYCQTTVVINERFAARRTISAVVATSRDRGNVFKPFGNKVRMNMARTAWLLTLCGLSLGMDV